MELFKIQKPTQEVADAIAAVLDVDVTIVDQNMYRVAATGKYKDQIGNRLPQNCSFEMVAKRRKPEFIEKPNISQGCMNCSIKGNCHEITSLGYPIINDGKLLGVIGVIAFNLESKLRIHKNYESLIVFLNKLGDLLAGNLNYIENITKLTIHDKMTNMIINEIDNGVIFIDNEGKIQVINSKAEKYLEKSRKDLIDRDINEVIPNIELDTKYDFYVEKKLEIGGKRKSLMIKNTPVFVESRKESNIIELNKTSNMIRDAFMLMEGENRITFDHIVGNSSELSAVKELASSVSQSESTVLIRGESGTGKELFARAIHNSSDKNNTPFIAINCASIPDNLLESELFGYEEGAFTGAKKEGQIGKFELANGGTLFLDEIGDLPLHLQPKILRAIQEKQFRRVGGKEIISSDFRLIAATNRDLEEMVSENKFREDLYYRLNVIPIYIPPLRERRDDIDILSEHLLKRHCDKLDVGMKYFSQEARQALNIYTWPGNIRELENVIEYLVNIVKEDKIKYDDLPYNIKEYVSCKKFKDLSKKKSLKNIVDGYEKEVLQDYLNRYGTTTKDKENIANMLDINLSTLYRKLTRYNLQ